MLTATFSNSYVALIGTVPSRQTRYAQISIAGPIEINPDFAASLSNGGLNFVMGHEATHRVFGDPGRNEGWITELQADFSGAIYAVACGASPGEIQQVFDHFPPGASSSHPPSFLRKQIAAAGAEIAWFSRR